jgi:hypothetical protein
MYKVFTQPASELSFLRDVILGWPLPIVVDESGEVVFEQMDEVLSWHPEYYGHALRRGSTVAFEFLERSANLTGIGRSLHDSRKLLRRLENSVNYVYMAHPFGFYAFGHFFDSVQRLRYALERVSEPFKVLHSNSSRIVEFEGHMRRLGVSSDQLINLSEPCVVPRLWITPWQSPPAQLTIDAYSWIYDRYTRGLDPQMRYKLYLTRNHVRPGFRGVTNEEMVVELLVGNGFNILRGDEPLDEMLKLFYGAKVIVGPHGSQFANAMFCQEGCVIREYCPSNRLDYSFKRKTKKTSAYQHISVPADEQFNIEIDLGGLVNFIDEF